ncbi:MAG: phosphoglycerate kinase, partial [Candidatus Eremiobacteraeota bacterium]|nr:phosphoglycerate kinase [Candidatus Eremiobacteraeota bacterium]
VFYRVDYNVPLDGAKITDATRIEETIPTIRQLRERGAAIVLASHLGRPKGERKEKYSLKPVRDRLSKLVGADVQWADDCIGADAETKARALKPGELLLVENLRFHAGEEKNDAAFAAELKKLGDFYVNDAFGASHRAHASIDALPRLFPKRNTAGGLLLAKEIEFLQKVTNVSQRPFVALLGGAKISGKIEPLEALVNLADAILVGGGMANTFLAAQGINVGRSLRDQDLEPAKNILALAAAKNVTLHLPTDAVVAEAFDADRTAQTVPIAQVGDAMILDIGPATAVAYAAVLRAAKTIVFNGPMGVYEKAAYQNGTRVIGEAIAAATKAGATSVVGGGDAAAAAHALGFAGAMTHVSTGGGATLEFLEGKTLPGVAALEHG